MRLPNIKKHWYALIEKQRGEYHNPASEKEVANLVVWVAVSDTAGSYEVNEEWVGVDKEGNLWWAYASGCSCWDGDYNTSAIKDIKAFKFEHEQHPPDKWLEAVKAFDAGLADKFSAQPVAL